MNAKEELEKRLEKFNQTLAGKVYDRLKLTRQIEDLDQDIGQLEGAIIAANSIMADMRTEEAILKATQPEPTKGGN